MTKTAVTGILSIHPRGFGFVALASPAGASAFVAPPDLKPFLTDDLVSAVLITAPDGRVAARALALVDRPRREVFGEIVRARGRLWLRIDRDVAATDWPLEAAGAAAESGAAAIARIDGDKVVLVRTLGPGEDRSLVRVIARHCLREAHGAEALAEARAVARKPHSLGHRRDLRDVPTVTVDAPSTRDIDDAISVLPAGEDGALRLLVSIADPSEFVAPGSALDREARERATSVYLADRVLPMLPEVLSADALSLWPGKDRLCLTAELRIDPEGRVTSADVYESLIRSCARLNYTELAAYLDRQEVSAAMEPVRASLPWFRAAAARLTVARKQRGGVEMSRDETHITFHPETGAAQEVEAARPTPAHVMIERFMVAANEAIGVWLHARGVPALYRVHERPGAERVADLAAFAEHSGFAAGFGGALTPLSLAAFDAQITGAASEPALRSVLLRALGPARYTVAPAPHFGLAAPLYLHFTSPLRRYADLQVHRTLKRYLRGEREWSPLDPEIEALGAHINGRARAASRAENDRYRMLVAGIMAGRIGQEFPARLTRVRSFGLIAQLDTTQIEGLVPAESLPGGPFRPDARETSLVGKNATHTIGQAVRVRIIASDPGSGKIDLALA